MQSREGSHVDRTRHCRGADSRARRRAYSPYKPPSKWQTLPTCHCEAPKGPWQSREGSHVDRTRHCRGADSRARRRTYSPYKPPSKWQTLPICHCEAPKGPWQSREGSHDFADSLPGIRLSSARLPRRFAPRNDTSGEREVHQRSPAVELLPTGRSLSAATGPVGAVTILTAACANRLCSAGRGMPLPYNGGYHETAAGTGRQCLPEIATSLRSSQ